MKLTVKHIDTVIEYCDDDNPTSTSSINSASIRWDGQFKNVLELIGKASEEIIKMRSNEKDTARTVD